MAERVFNAVHYPGRKLPKAYNGGTEVFPSAADPNTLGLTLRDAMGLSGVDGSVTVALSDGFTPSLTLTAWFWHNGMQKWVRLGANSTFYAKAFDATYTCDFLTISERTAFIIQASAAVTGDVYIDAEAHPMNPD